MELLLDIVQVHSRRQALLQRKNRWHTEKDIDDRQEDESSQNKSVAQPEIKDPKSNSSFYLTLLTENINNRYVCYNLVLVSSVILRIWLFVYINCHLLSLQLGDHYSFQLQPFWKLFNTANELLHVGILEKRLFSLSEVKSERFKEKWSCLGCLQAWARVTEYKKKTLLSSKRHFSSTFSVAIQSYPSWLLISSS